MCAWKLKPIGQGLTLRLWRPWHHDPMIKTLKRLKSLCNDTYPYRLASAVSKTELCLFTIWYRMGCRSILERQTRPDRTRSGLGFDPRRPTRFANPDQTRPDASLGQGCKTKTDASLGQGCKTKTDASLGQGCIKTDSPLRPGRPYLDRGECNDTYPYRLASAVSKTELCPFTGWLERAFSAHPSIDRGVPNGVSGLLSPTAWYPAASPSRDCPPYAVWHKLVAW